MASLDADVTNMCNSEELKKLSRIQMINLGTMIQCKTVILSQLVQTRVPETFSIMSDVSFRHRTNKIYKAIKTHVAKLRVAVKELFEVSFFCLTLYFSRSSA